MHHKTNEYITSSGKKMSQQNIMNSPVYNEKQRLCQKTISKTISKHLRKIEKYNKGNVNVSTKLKYVRYLFETLIHDNFENFIDHEGFIKVSIDQASAAIESYERFLHIKTKQITVTKKINGIEKVSKKYLLDAIEKTKNLINKIEYIKNIPIDRRVSLVMSLQSRLNMDVIRMISSFDHHHHLNKKL